jgi:hypothetical protein
VMKKYPNSEEIALNACIILNRVSGTKTFFIPKFQVNFDGKLQMLGSNAVLHLVESLERFSSKSLSSHAIYAMAPLTADFVALETVVERHVIKRILCILENNPSDVNLTTKACVIFGNVACKIFKDI